MTLGINSRIFSYENVLLNLNAVVQCGSKGGGSWGCQGEGVRCQGSEGGG